MCEVGNSGSDCCDFNDCGYDDCGDLGLDMYVSLVFGSYVCDSVDSYRIVLDLGDCE